MDAAKRYIALRLRLRGEEEWEVSYVLICCYSGLGVLFFWKFDVEVQCHRSSARCRGGVEGAEGGVGQGGT